MRDIKRTLWISGFSIFMAVVLLLGTTFAWFTDSVTNHGNKIQSGSLKVDLLMDEDGNDSYISIANQQGNIFSNQAGENGHNWEPGKTQLVYLAVENKESLALKYNVNLEISGELADYLEYTVIDDKKASEITAKNWDEINGNQRIIAGNAQFTGIAAGRGVGFTTGLLLLREGLGMRETPIRPHSWH